MLLQVRFEIGKHGSSLGSEGVCSLLLAVSLLDSGDDLVDLGLLDLLGGLLFAEPLATVSGLGKRVLLNELRGLGNNLSGWLGSLCLLDAVWVGLDGSVDLLPHLWDVLSLVGVEALSPLGELLLKSISTLLLERVVVVLDGLTEDVGDVLLGVEGGSLGGLLLSLLTTLVGLNFLLDNLEAWEALLVVWDEETTVGGTLHGTEDTVTGGGADETDIKVGLEWLSLKVLVHNVVDITVNLSVGLNVDLQLLEETAGQEETSSVGTSVGGETGGNTVLLELGGLSSAHGLVTSDGGEDNLAQDALVGAADAESVLLGVVLVLVLDAKTLTGLVVGLSFAAATELSLVSAAVGVALEDLNEWHIY